MERIEDIYWKELKNKTLTFEEVAEIQTFVNKKNPLSLYNNELKTVVPIAVKKAIKLAINDTLYSDFLNFTTSEKITELNMVATRCIFNDRLLTKAEEEAQFYFDHIKNLVYTRNLTKL